MHDLLKIHFNKMTEKVGIILETYYKINGLGV